MGESASTADAAGHSVAVIRAVAVLVGGAFAGLSGAYLTTTAIVGAWSEGLIAGRGWIAVALVIFGAWRAGRVATGAVIFGFTLALQTRLQPFMADAAERVSFLTLLHREAQAADLPPELVLALIEVESHFDRFAVSRVGAQGYMQVMPFWKAEIGRPEDNLIDTGTNLRYGCRILQFYWQREQGDLPRALAAYNGSLGRTTYSDKVYNAWQSRWRVAPLDW